MDHQDDVTNAYGPITEKLRRYDAALAMYHQVSAFLHRRFGQDGMVALEDKHLRAIEERAVEVRDALRSLLAD